MKYPNRFQHYTEHIIQTAQISHSKILWRNDNNFYALKDSRVFTAIIFYILIKPNHLLPFKISTAAIEALRTSVEHGDYVHCILYIVHTHARALHKQENGRARKK